MKFCVLLSGCGIADGSQAEEVILTYLALDKYHIDYSCIAPNRSQYHTVNHHLEKIEETETRSILTESARIGRGRIEALDCIKIDEFDGLIIPGGQGVFKNLSNFMECRENFSVSADTEELINKFYDLKKPIGVMCGGVILVGKALKAQATELKIGTSNNAFRSILELDNVSIENIASTEICIDNENKVVSTSAFLGSQNLYDIMIGIDNLIKALVEMTENAQQNLDPR